MTVGAGHDGAWARCHYRFWLRGLGHDDYGGSPGEWHTDGYEFEHHQGTFNQPQYGLNGGRHAAGVAIVLMRRTPLKMNQLREIDIMEGWLLPAKATRYDDEAH